MLIFLLFLYLPKLTTHLHHTLSPLLSILIPTLTAYMQHLALTLLTAFKILTYQPPHLALIFRLRFDEVHIDVLRHLFALLTWQPPCLRWLLRGYLPEWLQRMNVPENDDLESEKENEMKLEVEGVGKQQTIAEAATLLEAEQEVKYTDPILAVLSFLPSHKDVMSLLKVFWRFHYAMLNTGRSQKLKEKVEKTVTHRVKKTVAGVADVGWRAGAAAEGVVVGSVDSAKHQRYLDEEGGDVEMTEAHSKQPRMEDACENCPGCFDGSGCICRPGRRGYSYRYGYEYGDDNDSDSDLESDSSTTFSSECGSTSTRPSSFSSASTTTVNHTANTSSSSPPKKPTTKPLSSKPTSTLRRRNSSGRLHSLNIRVLPPPQPVPTWAQTPSERRKDPADFSDTYLRRTYRRRVGRAVKEGRGLEWHYSDQLRERTRPSWESL